MVAEGLKCPSHSPSCLSRRSQFCLPVPLFPCSLSMVAVGMAVAGEGEAFMAAVEGVSTAEAAGARTPVVEAGPEGDLTRLRLPATEVHALRPHMLRDPAVGTTLGPAIGILPRP